MARYKNFCLGHGLLMGAILVTAGFSYWLLLESENEKLRNFYADYSRLMLKDDIKQAKRLHSETLAIVGNAATLDEVWLPVVQSLEDGYDKLHHYSRILAGNTEREATYEEIAELIDKAPSSFQGEDKTTYLNILNDIPGVRDELLERYGLIAE